jgi:hypothetical protein
MRMPEPSVLYTVTAVVLAGLVVWVGYVLKTAKQPWTRAHVAKPTAEADVPVEPVAAKGAEADTGQEAEAVTAAAPKAEEVKASEPLDEDADGKDDAKAGGSAAS